MKVSKIIDAWGVPLMIVVGALLFGLHIQDAPAVAARVPNFVLIFIVLMLFLVVRQTLKKQRKQKQELSQGVVAQDQDQDQPESTGRKKSVVLAYLRQQSVTAFFALGVIYFLTFDILGFSISNFIFIFASMIVVKNYQSDFSLKNLPAVLVTSLITTFLLYAFAKLTSFNIPSGIFGI
jgi:membrane protein DedA with SNARE-associated domain